MESNAVFCGPADVVVVKLEVEGKNEGAAFGAVLDVVITEVAAGAVESGAFCASPESWMSRSLI